MLNWLKFHHIIHDTTVSTHQQLAASTCRKDILSSGPYCLL